VAAAAFAVTVPLAHDVWYTGLGGPLVGKDARTPRLCPRLTRRRWSEPLPGKSLQIIVNRPDGGTDPARATTSDGQGNVSYTFPNAGGSLPGTYQVTVTDADTNASASTSIVVLSASSDTTSSTIS